MNVSSICTCTTVTTHRHTPLLAAARQMRDHHVGCLVVVEDGPRGEVPVGLLTDRDIVVEAVAMELELDTLVVGDVIGPGLFTVKGSDPVSTALGIMRDHGIRRVPVLSEAGTLIGIITLDDVIESIAEEMGNVSRVVLCERNHEGGLRPKFSPHTTS